MNTKVPVENIVELTVEHQFLEAYPIMKQLHPHLTSREFLELLDKIRKDGYQLFAMFHDTRIVALAGIIWRDDSYNQSHVLVQDLITDASHRPSGLAYSLLNYIYNWAKDRGAEYITLES